MRRFFAPRATKRRFIRFMPIPLRLLFALMLAFSCAGACAQEFEAPRPVEHPSDRPDEHSVDQEKLRKYESEGFEIAPIKGSPADVMALDWMLDWHAEGSHGPRPVGPARHINWVRTRHANNTSDYAAYDVSPFLAPSQRPLASDQLHALYNSGAAIVNSGDVPNGANWAALTGNKGAVTVIHEKDSLNSNWNQISQATALGDRPLPPEQTVIFNALPQETTPLASEHELRRMNIVGSTAAWKQLNEQIRRTSAGIHSQVATRQALLSELTNGSSDVIVVYAHFDGKLLHLPGGSAANHARLADYTISLEDLAAINRTAKPAKNRVIVLASCSTAAHPSNTNSLVQILLKQGIAGTVLATDKPYDARNIPTLMTQLKNKVPLRQAGGQLRQYVELLRQRPWPLPSRQSQPVPFQLQINSTQESEIESGE